mmetsp:Transcript_29438/g.61921  ORF Transcript_29438/g.61921 Transcript_29438/m.61921 type:complete len:349 (-) Transcript_29438:334-1380(-)|eukprot:CAMPEP_0171338988 /NCGR_PEP_ID=MMETSP0878-20121228/7670_1 /TAXON_ID=67004 /ORGANISM="Thalassiosira weissflogii, Strain CCMP1336" /LENGTH=348 /DNA_ID=CAMNT_0011840837 /DNA_START=64 /DNA_END=1110 /DNA_ORIENTATION=-
MATSPALPYALEVNPESALQFTITKDPPTPNDGLGDHGATRCTMTLRHPGLTNEHLAFKVKTTQPRRYLVRPNQGIVAPGSSETVSILLVDKDRQVLWSTYDSLGQSALDHSKDKFLVQSCVVSDEFASQFKNEPLGEGGQFKKELVEALTAMWNSTSSDPKTPVYNKKLQVRHVVDTSASSAASAAGGGNASAAGAGRLPGTFAEGADSQNKIEAMSPQQLYEEVKSLRRKYEELVAFSVNLTAERDILNNTLEQTKRDLHREVATRKSLEKQGFQGGSRGAEKANKGGGGAMSTMVLAVIIVFFVAVRATNSGALGVLHGVPVVGGLLGFQKIEAPKKKHVSSEEL